MQGFEGHDSFMQDAEFLGEGTLKGDLRYFYSDYPILVNNPSDGKPVKGELYKVDQTTMEKLRKYEGIGDPFTCYTERVVKAQTKDGKVVARAFIVIPQIETPISLISRHIPERDWRKFVSNGKHLPLPKPLMLFFGGCILGAAILEIVWQMGLI